jgi:hypothetical protein
MPHPARTRRPELPPAPDVGRAFDRLARERALATLVRGGVQKPTLKRLLRDAFPRSATRELPEEIWSSLAVGIALDSPDFGMALAERLHDRLAWDQEPQSMDAWWEAVRERPLEALWMAALSENKAVRREFAHVARHCVENYRASPECPTPSWEYVEGLIDVQAVAYRELRETEKRAEDAERRLEGERERLEEQREELKRLRRENHELRSQKAQAERRAEALAAEARRAADDAVARRLEELERRLRKAEKEREHLERELARARSTERGAGLVPAPASPPEAPASLAATAPPEPSAVSEPSIAADPNPRRRVLRQILRKLLNKGKVGASHTHEDNVYRGVADHEKGIAKEAMELLTLEGILMPKPTAKDPHVALSADRTAEVRAIIAGEVAQPRLQRWIEAA